MSIFVPNNSGTVTFTNGSTTIAGLGTLFTGYRAGSVISIPGIGEMQLAADPTSDTVAEGIVAWQGATAEDKAFQYLPRNEEGVFTDKLTQLLSDLGNGNMQALAGLTLSASKVLIGTGPGALGLADRSEFVNGVRFNARVPDEAGLAPYASKPGPTEDEPGYTVLIEAYGSPPRTVLVSKASDTSGDWTDPAYIEGAKGDKGWAPLTIRVEDGERQVIQLSGYVGGEGDAPTANVGQYLKADGTWTATIGDALDVRGASFNWVSGGYNGANAYAKRDALRDQGASWIALQVVPPGNPPPTLPTTANAYWDLMAEPGEDGEGLVNGVVAGTGIAVDNTDPTAPEVSLDFIVVAGTGIVVDTSDPTAPEVSLDPAFSKLPPRYWYGFQHSNSVGSPNTQIDIAAGSARDSTDAIDIINSSGILNLATSGANGLDAGSLANSTWYYTFAIAKDDGSSAFLASTSPTAPTLPATYTKFRRIGSFRTNGSAQVLPFIHVNDTWYWATTIRDKSAAADVGTTLTALALSVPRVYGVTALISVTGWNAGGAVAINVVPGFLTDTARNGFTYYFDTAAGGTIPGRVMVNASAQVGYRASVASTNLVIDTAGWVDPL